MTLALLHTSPVHVPVFDALRDREHPGLVLRHLVAEDLLVRARERGPGAVGDQVAAALAGAVAEGASAVLCTCSTIGGVAEAASPGLGVPVLRVDRPMAERAARAGRIVVVASVESTFGPTVALIQEEAGRRTPADRTRGTRPAQVRTPRIRTLLAEGAWTLFEAGDRDGYLDAVAAAVDSVPPGEADVVVLAQASMADAAGRARTTIPVLSSPRLGLAAGAEAVRR